MTDFDLLRFTTALTLAAVLASPRPGLAQYEATTTQPTTRAAKAGMPTAPRNTTRNSACPLVLDLGAGDLSGPLTEYARAAELAGAAPIRSRLFRRYSDEARLELCAPADRLPWGRKLRPNLPEDRLTVEIVKPQAMLVENSTFPDDRNDGALWAGRGKNTLVMAGVAFRWGKLSGAILPTVTYQENQEFETITSVRLAGYSQQIHPWHPGMIDWPQRFGTESYRTVHPGQSFIRFEDRGLALTLSTENLWWGPAQRYPILLGNTAPGFPHIVFGTARPRDVRFAELQARAIWGRLDESPHFDEDPNNDHRLFAGVSVELRPYVIPGFYLGLSRVHVVSLAGLGFHRQLIAPVWGVGGDSYFGQHPGYRLLGISGRWVFPEAGVEFYGEWVTRAQWTGLRDFLREPGRGQAFLLGFQHLNTTGRFWVRTYGELVQLGGSPKLPRYGGPISYYTDVRIPQGHTHRGQLLGAAIGPGSDAQILGIDLISPWTTIGIFAERIRHDDDTYFTYWTRYYGPDAHDISLRAGVHHNLFLGPFSLGWELTTEDRRNRNFIGLDGVNWNFLREHNLGFRASVGWRPGYARHSFRTPALSASRERE